MDHIQNKSFGKLRFIEIVFVLPVILIVLVFMLIPILQSIVFSFFQDGEFVGLSNYKRVFLDKNVINLEGFVSEENVGALGNNIIWVLVHMPVTILLGLFFALALSGKVFGRSILRTLIFIGITVPMVIGGVLARFLFSQYGGIIPKIFSSIGVESLNVNWLAQPNLALLGLIMISIWLWVGYCMIMFLSALTTLDKSQIESAQIDGANKFRILISIILPHLKPVTYVIITVTLIWELKLFDIVYASTGGGPGGATNVLSLEMYRDTFKYFDEGKGASIAVIMLLLCVLPIVVLIKNHVKREV